jgi:glycosyltransferase involved in cell wall biosynthesis
MKMRVLFLTNFYQTEMGGEEESCRQVVEGLKKRGHETLVLTSMHGTDNTPVESEGISRSLYLEMDLTPWRHSLTFFTKRKARERHNLERLERTVQAFEPDVIFIWGMWNLPTSLAALAEERYPEKVVYRFATYWPTLPSQHKPYWLAPGRRWYSRAPKRVVGAVALAMVAREERQYRLRFERAICVSAATRDMLVEAGVPVAQAQIIYTGLDESLYANGKPARPEPDGRPLQALYAGRLTPEKGVETAIEAMARLVLEPGHSGVRLSLAGSGLPEYENHLRDLVARHGLTGAVTFLGRLPPEEMPALMRQFDVMLLPSIWPEPFARVVLEGMLSGLVVVATPTGGTGEVVVDGENGLVFAPGDAGDLARQIGRLIQEPQLRQELASAGKQTVLARFTVTRMMDEMEGYLQQVAAAAG